MIEVSRKLYRTCLLAALSAAVFNFGCNKKPISAPPPTARTEAPAPRPTITFQANPTSINKGDTTTLSWSTTNATQVAIAPEIGPVSAEGSTKVTPTDSATYTLTATGPGGTADASVRVTIAAANVEPTDTDRDRDRIFKERVKDAYFDLDKADIRPDARTALAATAEVLRAYPDSVAGLALVKGSLASCEVLRRRDTRHRKEGAGEHDEHEVCGQSFHVPLQSPESL